MRDQVVLVAKAMPNQRLLVAKSSQGILRASGCSQMDIMEEEDHVSHFQTNGCYQFVTSDGSEHMRSSFGMNGHDLIIRSDDPGFIFAVPKSNDAHRATSAPV